MALALKPTLAKLAKRPRHYFRWALLHAAIVLFFCDMIAAIWPAFDIIWRTHVAHIGVAIAAFAATLAEFITEEEREDK